MALSRSTYYDKPSLPADAAEIVAAMIAVCDELSPGWRRTPPRRDGCQFQEDQSPEA
jgi:hypothetical protein